MIVLITVYLAMCSIAGGIFTFSLAIAGDSMHQRRIIDMLTGLSIVGLSIGLIFLGYVVRQMTRGIKPLAKAQ